ncbi:ATP-binding protein [Pelagicoccus sp. SDUM812002]|uniref:ATP-binding protein n=1 Tax=Pelagicoccus sp. SDUM812002 TaxID=3041266 RepID=UPI00280F3CEF|nr:ATP-binding protein [Pelagicoccus sp. SDUM812002]MDQ8187554.1 histidine kinase dimerization/phospho-acceptor domain-containing protein [Pelagicoccus sp. SDUM812002]
MKSFRVRIILWTTVIAGVVMLGFGIAGNVAFKHAKEKQVEDALQRYVERVSLPPSHRRFWDRIGPIARADLQESFGTDVIVAVYGREELSDRLTVSAANELTIESWGNLRALFPDTNELPEVMGRYDTLDDRPRGSSNNSRGFAGREPDRGPPVDVSQPKVRLFRKVNPQDNSHWRLAVAEYSGYNVLVGVNFEKTREDTALMQKAFAIAFPVALIAMASCIWIFVTKAISPVRKLSETIASVSAKRLGERLDSEGEYSEFASLIEHFNSMLERLEGSFTQATRFSADAAHELKTPLAILQGQLEVALQQAEDGSDAQRLLGGLLEETHRLKSITRKLLILAKADAGTLEIQSERVDLKKLVQEILELAREDNPGADLVLKTHGEMFETVCDETLTRQILNNLIGNALKYRMPDNSEVNVRLEWTATFVAVEIVNSCAPVSAELKERLFDRFIRGDSARNRSVDGTGLGLSLSLEFAKAQNGHLSLCDSGSDNIMCLRLELPVWEAVD